MQNKSKKKIIVSLSILLILTLALIGVTYAYYRTRIYGNTKTQSLNVTSGTVGVKYNDNNASIITGSEVTPGYIATKTFSVENTGDNNVYFNIIFDNVTNGFDKGIEERGEYIDWVYRLYSGSTKNEDNLIKKGEITTASLQVLESNIEVKTGETNEYYLEIEYLYRQYVNQSADMGQTLSLRVNIEETVSLHLASTIIDNAKAGLNGVTFVEENEIGDGIISTYPAIEASFETESILSYTDDNYTVITGNPSYYFRGNVESNYVNFAEMCFRIVRIDGNGNIKLILDDKDTTCDSSTYSGDWNVGDSNFGYYSKDLSANITGNENMISFLTPQINADKSMVKVLYDYQNLLEDKIKLVHSNKSMDDYLISGNWCLNDTAYMEVNSGEYKTLLSQNKTIENLISSDTTYYYDSSIRLNYAINNTYDPTLKCTGTILSEFSSLIYNNNQIIESAPMFVGAITVDEAVYAGGRIFAENTYYLNKKGAFSTLSPSFYSFTGSEERFLVDSSLGIDSLPIVSTFKTRPMIVLKSNVLMDSAIKGQNGTQEHPYVIG